MFNLQLIEGNSTVLSLSHPLPNADVNLSSDSRIVAAGELFIALSGERFDATDFILTVLDKNVKAVVFQSSDKAKNLYTSWREKAPGTILIEVTSAEKFLAELATSRMIEWKRAGGMVIGITGSNGKTTHKEMLTHLLNALMPNAIHATRGNLNNHLGVPFTILQLSSAHKLAIIEMGTNHPGEIAPLCAMALPDAGIITNIGDSHLEFFKTREGVFNDKRSLFDSIEKNSGTKKIFVHINSDPFLASLPRHPWVKSFGRDQADEVVSFSATQLIWRGHTIVNHQLVGEHNYSNLAGCLTLAQLLFASEEKLVQAACTFTPRANRSQLVKMGEKQYYMDAYNANPSSMKAAIAAVLDAHIFELTQTLFILGDMNELGEAAPSLHAEVGAYCRERGIVHILFVGRYRQHYLKGWTAEAMLFDSSASLVAEWPKIRNSFQNFFIKGSRSLQLESLTAIT